MHRRPTRKLVQNTLVAATAALCVGSRFVATPQQDGPVLTAAAAIVHGPGAPTLVSSDSVAPAETVAETDAALDALAGSVRALSHPLALRDAFRSYFAYRAAHPGRVTKPYLYFVDYGLPNTTPRGYVFDMASLAVVDGPFMVAHGRGSGRDGVPTRFSNGFGSATTSLGLYVAQELYAFVGHTGGQTYRSIGLRLQGVSAAFNDHARDRGVVAHGAPYVTATRAGRSEGCPAVDPARAERILPKLANGGLVFLFAPDANWMARDPWIAGNDAG